MNEAQTLLVFAIFMAFISLLFILNDDDDDATWSIRTYTSTRIISVECISHSRCITMGHYSNIGVS